MDSSYIDQSLKLYSSIDMTYNMFQNNPIRRYIGYNKNP